MRRTEFAMAAAALWALLALPAGAQASCTNTSGTSCRVTSTPSATEGGHISLDFKGRTTTLTARTSLTPGTDIGVDNGPTFTVKADPDWQLSIKSANATDWDYLGTSSGVKPIHYLKWSPTSGGTNAGVDAARATLGAYSLPVVFTLSTL